VVGQIMSVIKLKLIMNAVFIVLFSTQICGAMSSVAGKTFIANADQFQPSEGVHLDDLYKYMKVVEAQEEIEAQESGSSMIESYKTLRQEGKKKSFYDMTKLKQKSPTKNKVRNNSKF
jgi:hypothetical protein